MTDKQLYMLKKNLYVAFQSKKQGNLGIGPKAGGVKKSKKSQVSVGKSSKRGGGHHISKKSQVSKFEK